MNIQNDLIKFDNLPVSQIGKGTDLYAALCKDLDKADHYDNHRYGKIDSTYGYPESIVNSKEWPAFLEILKVYIEKAKTHFGIIGTDYKFRQIWANRMHKGSKVYNHSHSHKSNDKMMVGVLYLEAPAQSGKFAVTTCYNKFLEDWIPPYQKTLIAVNTGDLIFHKSTLWHAVGEHQSDEPRTSIIFEIDFA